MAPVVLVCPKSMYKAEGEFLDVLVQAGCEVRYPKVCQDLMSTDQVAADLDGVDAVVAGSEIYTAELLERFPKLRLVSRVGVGYDSVDVAAASRLGKAVMITPGTNHDSVAELTFAFLLSIAKRVVPSHVEMASGVFNRQITMPVRGKTIGLVGFGRIGRAVARRAIAFDMRVLVYDPVATVTDGESVDLDTLLSQSDIVSLHAPAVAETRHLICKETIEKMKPNAILINTARGPLVDEKALAEALASGRIAAAGLDVFEVEPPVDSPILKAPNVVMTPHVGGIDAEGIRQMAIMSCQNVVDLCQGRRIDERIVNAKELGPDWKW